MNFSSMTVLIAGLGVSGRAARSVLLGRAKRVITVDESNSRANLHSFIEVDWNTIDLVVVSPVFTPREAFILHAQSRGIPVISEVELAWLLRADTTRTGVPAPWIGITGTNGKTTTTQMVSSMMEAQGLVAPAVGNIGKAVSLSAADPGVDALCVELSSFQMHFTDSLELDCAAITNIAADHLDWHGGMSQYAADKAKVFQHVKRVLVFNADDERVSQAAQAAVVAPGCKKVGFTLGRPAEGQIGVSGGKIVDRSGLSGEPHSVKDDIPESLAARLGQRYGNDDNDEDYAIASVTDFPGLCEPDGTVYPHLLADALTALALALGAGANVDACLEALRRFAPGDHRIETVAQLDTLLGATISFVDDSKATNASAAAASLKSYPEHSVVWIAGGLPKGGEFGDLVREVADRLKAVVVIGVDQQPMRDALEAQVPRLPVTYISPDEPSDSVMNHAVQAAGQYALGLGIRPGTASATVLMAPACASMDQFASYAQRGERFCAAAKHWVYTHE